MKITYPECQIEISTEEIIDLLNHFIESTSSRKHVSTKEPDMSDEQPAPKPYPNLTDQEAIIKHPQGFQDLILRGLEEAEAQGKLPEELTHVEIPKEENTPVEIPIERKNESTKKKKASSKPKKVEILFTTGWETFDSVSEAAKAIGVNYKTFYHNLTHGKPCKKHQVRYANPELDASLAEIKERDRQPYQPSKPIR